MGSKIKEILNESPKDLSELPVDLFKNIQKFVKVGAKTENKDNEVHEWANALQLVDWAYAQSKIEIPTPDMDKAWNQYEIIIEYAVQQLAYYRGVTGSWRTSLDLIKEHAEYKTFVVEKYNGDKLIKRFKISKIKTVRNVIESLQKMTPNFDDIVVKQDKNKTIIESYKHNIKQRVNYHVSELV